MSTPGETLMYARGGRRRKLLNVDLNNPPPSDHNESIPLTIVNVIESPMAPVQQGRLPTVPVSLYMQGFQPQGSTPPVPIDVEALDDDVIIATITDFEEARNSSRRVQARTSVVNVESAGASRILGPNRRNHRKRLPPQHFVINLEGSSCSMKQPVVAPPPPPPPPPPPSPPPPPPTFNCPVCMGPLVEEVATKCGHIFCKGCIKTAIATVPKCPTCRRKITNRGILRIYLPAAN